LQGTIRVELTQHRIQRVQSRNSKNITKTHANMTARAGAFTSAAAPASSSSSIHDKKTKQPWTNLNSDKQCLREDAGWIRRAFYAINLRTGFYTLNPRERASCYIVLFVFLFASILCTVVFVRGMMEGFRTEYASSTAWAASAGNATAVVNVSAGTSASVLEQPQDSSIPKVEL